MKSKSAFLCTVAAAALLSACATKPQISSQQESSQYLSRAHRNYAAPGSASDPWGPYIAEASAKYDVPERWIREVMRQESGGRLYGRGGELITSGAGAMGLMQVMPATYDDLRGRYRELGADPFDPHNNILAGTAYIREMYDIYGSPGFLAAYNAGPGRLDDYLTRNRTLPEETRRYVASIGPKIAGAAPSTPSPGQQYAMNAVPFDIPSGPRYGSSESRYASRYSATPAPVIALNPAPYVAPYVAPVASAPPIQLAAAPQQFIRLSPPAALAQPEPAFTPAPLPVSAPIQLAEVPEPPRPVYTPAPRPMQMAEAPELPRPVPAPRYAPMPAPRPMQFARLPEPPVPVAAPRSAFAQRQEGRPYFTQSQRPVEVAEMPEPPRRSRGSSQQMEAAAELVPGSSSRSPLFGFIAPANAAPMHRGAAPGGASGGSTSGAWAVQVGAFANQGMATAATAAARDHVREVLGGARTSVAGVRQSGGTLYRARLTGLSRDAAAHACERLSRARTSCMVVSPDAQS